MPPGSCPHPRLTLVFPPPQAITASRQPARVAVTEYLPGPGCFQSVFPASQQPSEGLSPFPRRETDSGGSGCSPVGPGRARAPAPRRIPLGRAQAAAGWGWRGWLLPYPTSSAAGWGCGCCGCCRMPPGGSTQTSGRGSYGSGPSSARSASRSSTRCSQRPENTAHPHLGVSTPRPASFQREATGLGWAEWEVRAAVFLWLQVMDSGAGPAKLSLTSSPTGPSPPSRRTLLVRLPAEHPSPRTVGAQTLHDC